jgi:hypothetical protein
MVEGSILASAIYFINNSKGLAPSPVYMECTRSPCPLGVDMEWTWSPCTLKWESTYSL